MSEDRLESDKFSLVYRAEAALDARLADSWSLLWEAGDPIGYELVAGLMRLAYATGYRDALDEPAPGALYRALGVVRTVGRTGPDEAPRGRSPGSRGSSGR